MSKVVNFYKSVPKSYLNDKYYNPNSDKGVPIHPFRLLIAGAAGAGKTNCMMNLITDCNNFERIYLYAKSLDQPLYKFLIDKLETLGRKHDATLITYSDDMKEIPKPTEFDTNVQNLIIFDDCIMEKKLTAVEELYVRGRHNNISVAFLSQSFHAVPKIIRLNCNYIILRGIGSLKDLRLIMSNYSLGETIEEFNEMYKRATKPEMSWLMIDLQSDNPKLKYRCNYEPISVVKGIPVSDDVKYDSSETYQPQSAEDLQLYLNWLKQKWTRYLDEYYKH